MGKKHDDEPLMSLHPKTDAEKLIWERHSNGVLTKENKALKVEIGVLKSELDELKHLMKTEQLSALILKNRMYKQQLLDHENRIKDLKRENERLLEQVIKFQTKNL